MSQVSRTTAKGYFNTGDVPTESQFANFLDSVPFPEDAVFTALSGTAWDGSYKTKTLTSNLALTFSSTKKSGALVIRQDATGSRTLTIGGNSIPIGSGANSVSIVTFIYDETASQYLFSCDTSIVSTGGGGGGDVTAPSVVSISVENANPNKIIINYDETLNTASGPDNDLWTPSGGRSVISVSIIGGAVTLTVDTPYTNADTITLSYAPGAGAIEDVAGNNAPSFSSAAVTNNIVSTSYTIGSAPWDSLMDIHELIGGSPSYAITTGPDAFNIYDLIHYPTTFDVTRNYHSEVLSEFPTVITSGINGRKTLSVVSGKTIPQNPLTYTGSITVFIVAEMKGTLPTSYSYITRGQSSALGLAVGDTGFASGSKALVYDGTLLVSSATLVVDTPYVFAIRRNNATKDVDLFVNGTNVGTGNHPSMPLTWEGARIGDASFGASAWVAFYGQIREVVTDANITSLTNSIKTRFGIA